MGDREAKCPTCGAPLESSSYKCSGCGRDVASFAPTRGDAPAVLPPEATPSRIGEFQILRTIGRGGMGTVYEAYQESMHRRVALKVLNAALPLASNEVARFEREAWIGGRLSHPNIVRVYGQGAVGTTRYIAMELVEGESLAAAIEEAKRERAAHSPSDSILRTGYIRKMVSMFAEVADALQHVHEHGIVHRDIKPLNLLLTKDKARLLLTDFGLARDPEVLGVTRQGDFMGTVRYMSPEQLLAQRVNVDRRTDIWSLGVSLYEAVTLELPYSGDSEAAYMAAVSMRDPTPAGTRDRSVPRDLETLLMKCLQRDPERRYATAAELKDDLTRFLEDRPVLARRPGPILKVARLTWRHRLTAGAVAMAAILVLAVVGAWVSRARHQAEVERIRWTLQQVIDSPKTDPYNLQPDWGHLQDILHKEVRRDPHGGLALLAQRAACRVSVDAAPFGLLSEMPDLMVTVSRGVDPGKDFLNIVYVEGALDNGPWEPIGSAACGEKDVHGGFISRDSLDKFFPRAKLTPSPHEIKSRATYRLFDPSRLSAEAKDEISKHNFVDGSFDNAWPAAREVVPLFTETRELEAVSIDLFTEYPKDFPRKVLASQTTGLPLSWSHLYRIRIVRVKLPPGSGTGFALEWPQDKEKGTYCAPQNAAKLTNPVVGIEFFGQMQPPVPLAADATVWSDRNSKALLSFPIVWSEGSNGQLISALGHASITSQSAGPAWSYNMMIFATSGYPLPTLPDGTEDGTTSGRIDFVPSRSVALASKFLDHYFGDKVSIPVWSLEVITVHGEWVQKGGCQ